MPDAGHDSLLSVRDLSVVFDTDAGPARAVRDVSFDVPRGKTVGLVGESGCGKSVTSYALLGLVDAPGRIASGEIVLNGRDLRGLSPAGMRQVRGREAAMIFQEPMTSLNPVYTIGNQIAEAILVHEAVPPSEAMARTVKALADVGIPNPELCVSRYPHELSGGMKQRAMIAMALVGRPRLLIADEPTTALDVTVQAQILDLLRKLQDETGMSLLFITHDLAVVAELAHEVCVMYAGRMVEKASAEVLFAEPLHPYAVALLRSLPQTSGKGARLETIPGAVPSALHHPEGCPFHPRCPRAMEICRQTVPPLEAKRSGRMCACHDVKKEADS